MSDLSNSGPGPAGSFALKEIKMQTTNDKTILVTGATGHQGGAVAEALLRNGYCVKALTRHLSSAPAIALKNKGAVLCKGDFDDSDSLIKAMSGVDTVFAMGSPFVGEATLKTEIKQGQVLCDIAFSQGVSHLIYTSAADADRNSGVPHMDSKFEIEKYIRESGIPYTIIGPAYFMDNLTDLLLPGLAKGLYMNAVDPEKKLQQILMQDLGNFVALIVGDSATFLGKRIDIASDELSGKEAAAILSQTLGREITCYPMPAEQLVQLIGEERGLDMSLMFNYYSKVGMHADVEGLRKQYPQVGWHRFADWVRRQDWTALLADQPQWS